MVSELTVTIKDEEKSLTKKFLVYETYTTDENDPIIKDAIDQTLKNFDAEPSNVIVKIKLEIQ